jgi:hypothetical protein
VRVYLGSPTLKVFTVIFICIPYIFHW